MQNFALTVLGAGSYGTALALAAASSGHKVCLWARSLSQAQSMQQERCNSAYLPGVTFPPSLTVTSDLALAVSCTQVILVVVPSEAFASVLQTIKPMLVSGARVAWATKGLEMREGRLLSQVAGDILGPGVPLAALSGPTFARELARGMPTAIAVAGTDQAFTAEISSLLHTPFFRIYESPDLTGLQIGGAVKNVIAIGAGMSDGLGYGANARTALITRGLAEIIRLGVSCGATERCFMGLSGLGDLILTCTDNQSRNRRFGLMTGQGLPASEALHNIGQVVEGYVMTPVVKHLADRMQVDMPICQEIFQVVHEGKNPRQAAADLLSRALTRE